MESVLQSLTSMDEEDMSNYAQRDPTDPTRFFQQVGAAAFLF